MIRCTPATPAFCTGQRCVGTPESNLKLSEARANTVAAARLTAKGYGQTVPVADNRIEEGRAKNRRVELVKK